MDKIILTDWIIEWHRSAELSDWPVQSADNSGTYSTMGTTLVMSTDLDGREYCVQGDTLHFVYAHPSDPQQDYDTALTR